MAEAVRDAWLRWPRVFMRHTEEDMAAAVRARDAGGATAVHAVAVNYTARTRRRLRSLLWLWAARAPTADDVAYAATRHCVQRVTFLLPRVLLVCTTEPLPVPHVDTVVADTDTDTVVTDMDD